jgi:hypothetical protein
VASGALTQAKGLGKVGTYVDRFDRDGHPQELRDGQHFTDELSVTDALRLIETGARMEMMGRGLPGPDESGLAAPTTHVNPIIEAVTKRPDQLSRVLDVLRGLDTLLPAGAPGETEPVAQSSGAADAAMTEV